MMEAAEYRDPSPIVIGDGTPLPFDDTYGYEPTALVAPRMSVPGGEE